jgi:ATP-dependent Clp protease adaptor protein ClpS
LEQSVSKQVPAGQTRVSPQSRSKVAEPLLYRVLMHNDDYTTMEFVVQMLETVFHKPATEAQRIMLNIHFRGVGMCGTYPFEIAETKVARVHYLARESGFPLRCSLEEA